MNIYNNSPEDLTEMANQTLDLVIRKACQKGFITEEQLQNILKLRVVISDRQNIFSRMFEQLFGVKEKLHIHVVTVEKE